MEICKLKLEINLFFIIITDLIQCTNEMNVNIPQLADSLFERTTNSSWVVVFKSLITTHHLMVYGNEVRTTFKSTVLLCGGWVSRVRLKSSGLQGIYSYMLRHLQPRKTW